MTEAFWLLVCHSAFWGVPDALWKAFTFPFCHLNLTLPFSACTSFSTLGSLPLSTVFVRQYLTLLAPDRARRVWSCLWQGKSQEEHRLTLCAALKWGSGDDRGGELLLHGVLAFMHMYTGALPNACDRGEQEPEEHRSLLIWGEAGPVSSFCHYHLACAFGIRGFLLHTEGI